MVVIGPIHQKLHQPSLCICGRIASPLPPVGAVAGHLICDEVKCKQSGVCHFWDGVFRAQPLYSL